MRKKLNLQYNLMSILREFIIILLHKHSQLDKRNRFQLFVIFDVTSLLIFEEFVTLTYTPP